MQKFPLRNRCKPTKPNNNKAFGSDTHIRKRRRDCCSPHEMPPPIPQRQQRICQPIPSGAPRLEKCQLSMKKPASEVKVCNRVLTKEAENVATWDEVLSIGCKPSKSLPSAVSSSSALVAVEVDVVVDSNTEHRQRKRQEPVQPTAATSAAPVGGIFGMPCNVTASSSSSNSSINSNNNNYSLANGNRNKDDDDDDDDNNRRSRQKQKKQQQHPRIKQAEAAVMPADASASEFMTFERLRLGDQINFLHFDPYRTLKFLITELKSRLKTVVPDDINVQKILVEIQQTMKRIRNASEPLLQPVAPSQTTTTTKTISTQGAAMAASASSAGIEYILPKERCHVIKNDPLINHARKVNSSCQTIASQLENVNACQMCEHQVNKGTAGCNQSRINETSNADDRMLEINVTGAYQQWRSKDHRKDTEVRESFSCKSLQDAIEDLKIQNNPFSHDTQRIITQLEVELLNFQRELQRTSSCCSSLSVPPVRPLDDGDGKRSTQENLKVQGKRLLDKKQEKQEQDENEEDETFLDFIAYNHPSKSLKNCNRLRVNSSSTNQQAAGAFSISKESQTNFKSSTQMFCHLEKEKLLLLQQFRTSEMQSIQGDLNELHAFIKDQLNGIYHSITRDNQNLKYYSNDQGARGGRGGPSADMKNKQKNRQKIFRRTLHQLPERIQAEGLPPLSSSPSLTAPPTTTTSWVLLSDQVQIHGGGTPSEFTSILPRHYKKSSPIPADSGNANNTKSMMKQKSSSSLLSAAAVAVEVKAKAVAADSKETHNISDVDKADKALGEKKKSREPHQQPYDQKHLFVNCRGRCRLADTPFCTCASVDADAGTGGEKNNFSDVDCGCSCSSPRTRTRTQRMDGKVQRMMTTKATTRTSTTKSDINSTKATPLPSLAPAPAVMTYHQRHQQPTMTTGTAQDRIQLISSSLPTAAAVAAAPSYITTRTTTDETSVNPDTVTNAAVKTIIKDAYATTVTTATTEAAAAAPAPAGHSNGIRMPSHQAHNSWQCVNLKNPTGCQLKKQICGPDGYECRINNNNNNNANRSNYPEIHDCQKYRANSINPFCGRCSTKMHEFGADNGATAFASAAIATTATTASAAASASHDYGNGCGGDYYRGYGDGIGAGAGGDGDGPINWNEETKSVAIQQDFTCHPEKRQQQRWQWRQKRPGLLHCSAAQSALQTDLEEFKEFLDEIGLSTPRTE